jgi:hypothetical protein
MAEFNIGIAAVGDIAFVGENVNNPCWETFKAVEPIFKQNDLVIGNLESPLLIDGNPVPGKCTLIGHPGWAKILKLAGFHFVSLANNHIMDYGLEGLKATMHSLEAAGIAFGGAGQNLTEASRPIVLTIGDSKIAIICRSSVVVNSPSYASDRHPGVACFELNEALSQICKSKKEADHVIVCLHWGLEHYRYPSTEQRITAEKLIDAGADLIIGHHPHVTQGVEVIKKGIVAYSLGNFIFDDFGCELKATCGETRRLEIKLGGEEKKGLILQTHLVPGEATLGASVFTRIASQKSILNIDSSLGRQKDFERVSSYLGMRNYSTIWKLYALRQEWRLRIKPRLNFSKILTRFSEIRPHHITELLRTMRKSVKISAEKTTNPYD